MFLKEASMLSCIVVYREGIAVFVKYLHDGTSYRGSSISQNPGLSAVLIGIISFAMNWIVESVISCHILLVLGNGCVRSTLSWRWSASIGRCHSFFTFLLILLCTCLLNVHTVLWLLLFVHQSLLDKIKLNINHTSFQNCRECRVALW